ncbi:MAG: hypothetical protein CMN32_10435, partial [Saprospirales bacterium]|nr:hypothetical protein [Saprospirales bacterium]
KSLQFSRLCPPSRGDKGGDFLQFASICKINPPAILKLLQMREIIGNQCIHPPVPPQGGRRASKGEQ